MTACFAAAQNIDRKFWSVNKKLDRWVRFGENYRMRPLLNAVGSRNA
jgi:hypothetical protein